MYADLTVLKKRVRTAADAMAAFSDETECRRILEAMVWPQTKRIALNQRAGRGGFDGPNALEVSPSIG